MPDTSILTACICLLVALFLWFRKSKASFASLPPGPKPVPFLGNVFDLTAKELWLPASRWAKQYVYVHVLGVGIVFLNTAEAACDLLDKRGSIYSDKPFLMMSGELCGCKNMVAFTPYGEQSKRQRRLLHKAFGLPVIPTYYPFLQTGTHAFLRRLVVEPSEYMKHIRRYSGGLTLSVVYGYEAVSNDDEFLGLAEECVGILSNRIASGVGIWPVDVFPSLRHLPTWMPGAGFKRNAAIWKKKMEEFVDRPYEFMKNSMKSGTHKASFCSNLLEDESIKAVDNFEFDLKWSANSMYSASIDTTITTVSHFILAMMMHTDAQRKAQEELDRVVGTERLPTFADRASLPFVECVFKESLRWAVPVPLSLPHRLMEDDLYNGMLIPKGTLIFGNIWAMLRNEAVFPDADAFRPERFLDKVSPEMERKRDPQNYVFGFGRRECPGSHLVDSSIWLLIASMLATLDVSKAVDECGNVMEPTVKFENPIFRTPSQFKCDMRPRSQKALSLIRQSEILTT
ncbi:cytochrome P450 [Gymnopilus junonius]|uniref:Cytochrome P450 n=1 Tax=Gymnopilus junonius TaxID=109634 RepID=A0A9P5NXW8_GYMJU|nr:cytochrome P450 [Gymnopilus junonius]